MFTLMEGNNEGTHQLSKPAGSLLGIGREHLKLEKIHKIWWEIKCGTSWGISGCPSMLPGDLSTALKP